MKRWLRILLIIAPVIVLLLGVPAGVAFASRTAQPLSVPQTGQFVGPRQFIGPRATPQTGMSGVVTRILPGRMVVYTKARKVAFPAVAPNATIRFNGKNVKLSALRPGDQVTILGRRDARGVFHAQLIRVTRPQSPNPSIGNAR